MTKNGQTARLPRNCSTSHAAQYMNTRLLPPYFRLTRRPASFQFFDEIQRTFDTRRVVTGALDIQTEFLSSNFQCLSKTSRLVPRMLRPNCNVLQLLLVPFNLLVIHVSLLRINKTLLLKQKDERLDLSKSLIPHIWYSRAPIVFDLLIEFSHSCSTILTCCAEIYVWLASRTIADEVVILRQFLTALSPRLEIVQYPDNRRGFRCHWGWGQVREL